MSNLSFPECQPERVVPTPESSRRIDADDAASLMVEFTRAWETDGGAVIGIGSTTRGPGDGAGCRDGAELMLPLRATVSANGSAAPGWAGVSDLAVVVVAMPRGTRIEVVVGGELDLATAPVLRGAVSGACRAGSGLGRAVVLVLDLEGVTFMDSAALHALADIDAQVAERGWTLRVTPPAGRGPRHLLCSLPGSDGLPARSRRRGTQRRRRRTSRHRVGGADVTDRPLPPAASSHEYASGGQ